MHSSRLQNAKSCPASTYNATVLEARHVHSGLLILRICPDLGVPLSRAGQYVTIGLSSDAPRYDAATSVRQHAPQLIRRAYSASHPLLDHNGVLYRDPQFVELYIALVPATDDKRLRLTPRLFNLQLGDRLFLDPKPRGRYTLANTTRSERILLIATGTGEAPHNAMIAERLRADPGSIVTSLVSVRHARDLAYLSEHRSLEAQFTGYRYRTLVTRDPSISDVVLPKRPHRTHLQDVFAARNLSDTIGWEPDPQTTHVFLCGHPQMIGLPRRPKEELPMAGSMLQWLVDRGFHLDRPRTPGNIHVEQYW